MKSIKTQYIDLMEGRMSQYNFMRSLRMSLPQYITNVTSFKDSVKILKNKGILSEAYANEAPSYDYNGKKLYADNQSGEPDTPGGKVSLYDEEENEYIGTISSIDREGFISVDPESIQPANGEDEDEEFIDMIAKAEEEEAGKYTKNYDFPGELSEKAHDGLEIEWDWDNADADYDTDEEGNEGAFGTVFGKDKKGNAYSARFDAPVSGGDADFDSADVSSIKKTEDASELYEGKKKKEKKELHPNQIHPQELRMGIKVELEHTDSLDKAKKIALDHLAENPFYYTALQLSGIESPSAPKAKAPKAAKKEKAAEAELVDKENAMKPVKGFEKAKASSNKAKKETNSGVKGVSELTHNAKSVRGLQKFAATGGKMKTIKLKEDYESFLSQKRGEEARAKRVMQATNAEGVKFSVNDIVTAPDGKEIKITGFTTGKDGKMKAMYSAGMFADVYNLDDLEKKSSFRPGVDLGKSFDKLKSTLESIVREVLDEMYDGRDDMNAENKY